MTCLEPLRSCPDSLHPCGANVISASAQSAQSLFPLAAWDSVGTILKSPGTFSSGYYRYNLPRRDITLHLGDVTVSPALALGAWAGISGTPSGAMVMGDLVLTTSELKPVVAELSHQRLDVTAIHNNLSGEEPRITYVHCRSRDAPRSRGCADRHAASRCRRRSRASHGRHGDDLPGARRVGKGAGQRSGALVHPRPSCDASSIPTRSSLRGAGGGRASSARWGRSGSTPPAFAIRTRMQAGVARSRRWRRSTVRAAPPWRLAPIVHSADFSEALALTPEGAGLGRSRVLFRSYRSTITRRSSARASGMTRCTPP